MLKKFLSKIPSAQEERKVLTAWNFGTRSTCVVRNTITPIMEPTTRNNGANGKLPKVVCQTAIKQLKWNWSWVVPAVMPCQVSIWRLCIIDCSSGFHIYRFAMEDITENISVISWKIIHKKRMYEKNIKK